MAIATAGSELLDSIEHGSTPPGSWYTDPTVRELEEQRIFRRSWQYVGMSTQIPNAGDFITRSVGRIPAVVIRDQTGEINAFVNVCRHRGSEIIHEESGNRKVIQCPYHAWTYALDGTLRRAPRSERNPDFVADGLGLHRLRVECSGSLIFVNPDPQARPFAEVYAGWPELVRDAGLDLTTLKPTHEFAIPLKCNWKVMTENNLECYHCPTNHPSLRRIVDTNADNWYAPREFFLQHGPQVAKNMARTADEGAYRIEEGARDDMLATYLWPNSFFAIMPGDGMVTISVALPVSAGETISLLQYCFSDRVDEMSRQDAIAFFAQVFEEDRGLAEGVQRGMASGYFGQGQLLLPVTEQGVHFHQVLVARALCSAEDGLG
jgi:choline monooxygenase